MPRRSPLVVLAVLSLVGSLLAVAAVPAAGEDGQADDLATYSACVGPAIESAGFEDVAEGSVYEGAIDCVAHYGIMRATSPGRFSPGLGVTRRAMALFLIRAAGPAGIEIPRAANQGFEDIDGLPRPVRDAINRLVDLGITRGTSTTTYSPDDLVTRRQMVHFLTRFLDLAPVGPGGIDIDDVESDDTRFGDIGDLPVYTHKTIMNLFEMGIARGTSETGFSPEQPVTRAQMAMFVSRMLAHTNARPAGITIQAGPTTVAAEAIAPVVVSVRDGKHRPVTDASIDLFRAPSWREAFENDGRCSGDVETEIGHRPCIIDLSDRVTDGYGNLAHDTVVFEDLVVWAWTGDQHDLFDLDGPALAAVEFTTIKPAAAFVLADDMHPAAVEVPYGRSVTFTFRLVDRNGRPAPEEWVAIRIRIDEEREGRLVDRRIKTYYTDSSGEVELSYRIRDPNPAEDDADSYLDINVLESSELEVTDRSTVRILKEDDDQGVDNRLPWSDDDGEPNALVLELAAAYRHASDSGQGAANTVSATLVDQYGDPVRGERIHFKSDDPDGLYRDTGDTALAKPRHRQATDRLGVATVSYHRKNDASRIETIRAFTEDEEIQARAVRQYWVEEAPEDTRLHRYEVLHLDEERNVLVIRRGGLGPYAVTFDSNDRFDLEGDTERFDSFRRNLDEGDIVTVEVRSHDPDAVNSFTRYE